MMQRERRILDLPGENEPLSPRKLRRRGQEPLEQIVRFRRRRRFGRHGAPENTRRENSASLNLNVCPYDACATQLCTEAVRRATGNACSAKAFWYRRIRREKRFTASRFNRICRR